MKSIMFFLVLFPFVLMLGAADVEISGDYVEVRTADIYTGPCFATSSFNPFPHLLHLHNY